MSDEPDLLLRHLRDHDEPCPNCRYALRGLRQPTCPECGVRLRLGVRAEVRLGAWLLALVWTAMAMGFDAVASVLMGSQLFWFEWSAMPGAFWNAMLKEFAGFTLGAMLCLAGTLMLLRWRPRWAAAGSRAWRYAATVVVIVTVVHVAWARVLYLYS